MKRPKKRKTEYREGKAAREAFEATMRALFQAPKTVSMSQAKAKRKSNEDRVSGASHNED